jgi:hypothetical protein
MRSHVLFLRRAFLIVRCLLLVLGFITLSNHIYPGDHHLSPGRACVVILYDFAFLIAVFISVIHEAKKLE